MGRSIVKKGIEKGIKRDIEKGIEKNMETAVSIYDFQVENAYGEEISLSSYRGKVLLIVNTATGCKFTSQYKELEDLYEQYHAQGLEILDFPCNQFGNQAPGTDEEIVEFCQLKYQTRFIQMKKVKVNGKDAISLYKWLKQQKKGLFGASIKWNFTKFLVDGEGNVIRRYAPMVPPKDLETDIKTLLYHKN